MKEAVEVIFNNKQGDVDLVPYSLCVLTTYLSCNTKINPTINVPLYLCSSSKVDVLFIYA